MLWWVSSPELGRSALRRARGVTIYLFFFNGIALSTLTPRLADLQGQLNMSDLALGLVLSAGSSRWSVFWPICSHRHASIWQWPVFHDRTGIPTTAIAPYGLGPERFHSRPGYFRNRGR